MLLYVSAPSSPYRAVLMLVLLLQVAATSVVTMWGLW